MTSRRYFLGIALFYVLFGITFSQDCPPVNSSLTTDTLIVTKTCTLNFSSFDVNMTLFVTFDMKLGSDDRVQVLSNNSQISNDTSGTYVAVLNGPQRYVKFTFNSTNPMVNVSYTNLSCSMNIADNVPQLRSPYFANSSAPFNCTYKRLSVVKPLSLAFTYFNVTKGTVTFRNSASTNGINVSGSDLPSDWLSTSSNDTITMTLVPSTDKGFIAAVAYPSPECTLQQVVNSSGYVIASPGYPSAQLYGPNLDCRWLIRSNNSKSRLLLQMTDLTLSNDLDGIIVKDGGASRASAIIASFQNKLPPYEPVISSSGEMWVKFTTDEAGEAKGFSFNVSEIVDGGRFTGEQNISFRQLSSQVEVRFVLQADQPANKVSFQLTGMNATQNGADVTCYEGETTQGTLLGRFQAGWVLHPVFAAGSTMLCVAKGFKALTEGFNGTLKVIPFNKAVYSKFSSDSADTYSLRRQFDSTMQFNRSFWSIVPAAMGNNETVIEITFTELKFYPMSANVTITLTSANNDTLYKQFSPRTNTPFVLRAPADQGLYLLSSFGGPSSSSPVKLTIEASYIVLNLTVDTRTYGHPVTEISSPMYPIVIPQNTIKNWLIAVPPNKSLALSFSPPFSLPLGTTVSIYKIDDNNITLVSGSTLIASFSNTTVAPDDLIINNTQTNAKNQTLQVSLRSGEFSSAAGFNLTLQILDTGFNTTFMDGQAAPVLTSPGYPAALNKSTTAAWALTWPKTDSKGQLYRVNASITTHQADGSFILDVRDGARSDSLLLLPTTNGNSSVYQTSHNAIYILYNYTRNDSNPNVTAPPFSITFTPNMCSLDAQCRSHNNQSVCMDKGWLCDGVYQCVDGKDESDCSGTSPKPTPTTTLPSVMEGAKWWVFGLSVTFAFIGGIVITVAVVAIISRRRGPGYSHLRDLMAPVPT